MTLPRLHIVTDDAIAAHPEFAARASALMDAFGPAIALHLRSRTLTGRALHDLATALAVPALQTGSKLLINERVDVALAARTGAHLGNRCIPVREARRLLLHAPLGYSAHTPDEALLAEVEGADFVFLGSIYRTESHPDRMPAGVELIQRTVPRLGIPVIGIGGITPERAGAVRAAGAWGAAVIRAVWEQPDPVVAARAFLGALAA